VIFIILFGKSKQIAYICRNNENVMRDFLLLLFLLALYIGICIVCAKLTSKNKDELLFAILNNLVFTPILGIPAVLVLFWFMRD
jgi:RsiW-degrading membrane proteinase PrsW (M82 family)